MYTIHYSDALGRTEHYGHVATMKRAREICDKLRRQGYEAQFWFVPDADQEFLPGY